MFLNPPQILAHQAALNNGNFATPNFILNRQGDAINLFNRFCPHRAYPLAEVGQVIEGDITCNFHGFQWSKDGEPQNNNRRLNCGNASIGKSGLILRNFPEPDHKWVQDLAGMEFHYSKTMGGQSNGSWLWMMEIQADLLHIRRGAGAIHPRLSELVDLDNVKMEHGDGWILQTHETGWWLFVYPFTFVEWSQHGCLSINYTIPNDINNEFGFQWITQFYYVKGVTQPVKDEFEDLENVFREDVAAIEKQRGGYFPLLKSSNRLEDHCVHFGEWMLANRQK